MSKRAYERNAGLLCDTYIDVDGHVCTHCLADDTPSAEGRAQRLADLSSPDPMRNSGASVLFGVADKSPEVLEATLVALGNGSAAAPMRLLPFVEDSRVRPALRDALRRAPAGQGANFAQVLGRAGGPGAKEALHERLAQLRDDPAVWDDHAHLSSVAVDLTATAIALLELDPEAQDAAETLVSLFEHPCEWNRERATSGAGEVLAKIPAYTAAGRLLYHALLAEIDTEGTGVFLGVAHGLLRLYSFCRSPVATGVVERVAQLLDHENHQVRSRAASVIWDALPPLRNRLIRRLALRVTREPSLRLAISFASPLAALLSDDALSDLARRGLGDESPSLREKAAGLLEALPEARARSLADDAVRDEPDARLVALLTKAAPVAPAPATPSDPIRVALAEGRWTDAAALLGRRVARTPAHDSAQARDVHALGECYGKLGRLHDAAAALLDAGKHAAAQELFAAAAAPFESALAQLCAARGPFSGAPTDTAMASATDLAGLHAAGHAFLDAQFPVHATRAFRLADARELELSAWEQTLLAPALAGYPRGLALAGAALAARAAGDVAGDRFAEAAGVLDAAASHADAAGDGELAFAALSALVALARETHDADLRELALSRRVAGLRADGFSAEEAVQYHTDDDVKPVASGYDLLEWELAGDLRRVLTSIIAEAGPYAARRRFAVRVLFQHTDLTRNDDGTAREPAPGELALLARRVGAISAFAVLPVLEHLLLSPDAEVRAGVMQALRHVACVRSLQLIERGLADAEPVRRAALRTLAAARSPGGRRILDRLACSSDAEIRLAAQR